MGNKLGLTETKLGSAESRPLITLDSITHIAIPLHAANYTRHFLQQKDFLLSKFHTTNIRHQLACDAGRIRSADWRKPCAACAAMRKSRTTTCGSAALPSTRTARDWTSGYPLMNSTVPPPAKAQVLLRIILRLDQFDVHYVPPIKQ